MTSHRCPSCLNLPLSQSIACSNCGGTGLFFPFKRPAHVSRLSFKSWHGVVCPRCGQVEQHQSWYPRNQPMLLVEQVVCACDVRITHTPFNVELFYDQLFSGQPLSSFPRPLGY